MLKSKLAYGIDFGTTNSTIALVDKNDNPIKISIDNNNEDKSVMRSVLYVNPDEYFFFGAEAIDEYLKSIEKSQGTEYKTVATGKYIKVLNSSGREELTPEMVDVEVVPSGRLLQSLKSALSNHTVKKITLFGRTYLIEELIGKYLFEIKSRADKQIGVNIDSAVIGRPVEYVGNDNHLALNRMKAAAEYAGFKNVLFEYEPIGAAYDYGINIHSNQNAVIFDFGGGTLDISVVKFPNKQILSNIGLTVGGDKFDSIIFSNKLSGYFGKEVTYGNSQLNLPRYIFDSLESWYGITILKTKDFLNSFENFRFMCSNLRSLNSLKSLVFNNYGFEMYDEIEKVKKTLTSSDVANYKFFEPEIYIDITIKKIEFEKMIEKSLIDIEDSLKLALIKAGMTVDDIDCVVTTGGSSLIPIVQKLLINFFGKEKIVSSNTFTSVASGLAQVAKTKLC